MFSIFILLFVLVFGPVLDVGLGQLGDTSFFCSIFIIIYVLVVKNDITVPKYIKTCLAIVFFIFILSVLNALLLDAFEIEAGFRAILRPIRVFIVVLSCYYCVLIIDRRMDSLNIPLNVRFITVVQLLYIVILIHAFLMCMQFVFPDFRDSIYSITFAKNQLEYNKLFRMAGLTGAGGAQTSFVQGLGCLLGWFLLFYQNYKHKVLVFFGNVIIIFSIILSGRTGLLVVGLGFALCLVVSFVIIFSKSKQNFSFNPFYLLLVIPAFSVLSSLPGLLGENYIYFETAFNRTFKTLIDFIETGNFQDDTVSALSEMIIIPDDPLHLLFGRSSYLEGNTYYNVMTDIGYFRLIWGYGLVGLLLHIFFYSVLLIKLFRIKFGNLDHIYLWCLPVSLIGFVFLMNSKEIFFMTRISSHIVFILIFFFVFASGRRLKHNI